MVRLSVFYDDIILVVGSLTALMAGVFGFFQNDLKRVIAFSTCSQLGYSPSTLNHMLLPVYIVYLIISSYLLLVSSFDSYVAVDLIGLSPYGTAEPTEPVNYLLLSIVGPGVLIKTKGYCTSKKEEQDVIPSSNDDYYPDLTPETLRAIKRKYGGVAVIYNPVLHRLTPSYSFLHRLHGQVQGHGGLRPTGVGL